MCQVNSAVECQVCICVCVCVCVSSVIQLSKSLKCSLKRRVRHKEVVNGLRRREKKEEERENKRCKFRSQEVTRSGNSTLLPPSPWQGSQVDILRFEMVKLKLNCELQSVPYDI